MVHTSRGENSLICRLIIYQLIINSSQCIQFVYNLNNMQTTRRIKIVLKISTFWNDNNFNHRLLILCFD